MSLQQNEIDNDIKNELLELANLVTQEFSECQDKQEDELRDLKYESFNRDKSTDDENDEKKLQLAANDFELSNEEFKLPDVDWENLEIKLKQAQKEITIQNKRANGQNDRDEIRRKLAIVSSSSLASSHIDLNQDIMISDYMRRPSLVKNTSGQNLQICFMNEMADDLGEETIPDENSFESPEMANSISSFSMLSINSSDSCDTFLSQLQHETKQALAKVSNSVKSKIQSESASKKPSPIADIVGLPTYGLKRLEREDIVDMNIGQLQVIVNDLCNQIEKINEDLKILLIDRDDLYMQQDSILVDIEDVTKRIKESAQKSKLEKSNNDLTNSASRNLESNDKIVHKKSGDELSGKRLRIFDIGTITNKLYRFRKKI